MTSQTPQGGGQVTVGTQLPQEIPLQLPPAPEKVLGACRRPLKQQCAPKQAEGRQALHLPHHSKPQRIGWKAWEIEVSPPGPQVTKC